ncbi:MAG: winged helix-turn-helix transcriptional regulator [Clostridiaceae bacterium]|jgi:DNA-binding transcriptional ArsR family regulator|nr:metalloregulator ArsR/SmtB family transcription factor [Bacillota bacterium]NLN52452.1 winged helix-turn-helix transcriptional regulator [Clostridiaceae bacterium]
MSNKLPHDHGKNTEEILSQMPSEEEFIEAANLFKQLDDGTRLRILWILCHTEECGINIASAVEMSPAAVAHHLRSLKLHGLITSRREGKEVYYKLAETDLADLIHKMIDSYFEMVCPTDQLAKD